MSPFEPVLDEKPVSPVAEPDLGTKVRYRLGWPISEEYRDWVERDIASPMFALWMLWPFVIGQTVALSIFGRVVEGFNPRPYLIGGVIAAVAVMVFFTDYKRRRALEWHEKRWKRVRERDESPDFRRLG